MRTSTQISLKSQLKNNDIYSFFHLLSHLQEADTLKQICHLQCAENKLSQPEQVFFFGNTAITFMASNVVPTE